MPAGQPPGVAYRPRGLAAEKFRFLGVRLRQLQQDRPLKQAADYQHHAGGREEHGFRQPGRHAGPPQAQKVLLLEGDLRRPSQAQMFGGTRPAGLSEWLQSGNPHRQQYLSFGWSGLLADAGRTPAGNPLELMQSAKLAELLDRLVAWFEWVVIDSPPILPLADTSVWVRSGRRRPDGGARRARPKSGNCKRGLEAIEQSPPVGSSAE